LFNPEPTATAANREKNTVAAGSGLNAEPTATAANREKNTVAAGSGLNDPLPILNY
jgi:hypothetical protein